MAKLPDRESIEDFADSMIKQDHFVNLSVTRDRYMTRDEYVVSLWIDDYGNDNFPHFGDLEVDIKARDTLLPEAFQAASAQFEIPLDKVKELYERSITIRSRHMPELS